MTRRHNRMIVDCCPECGRPTSREAAKRTRKKMVRRADSYADGWRCIDHARTFAEREIETKDALRIIDEYGLMFAGLVGP